jgi:hypothetical protein
VSVARQPQLGVTQIADRLGVSPATLYRYFPAARAVNTPDFLKLCLQCKHEHPGGRQ